MHPRWHRSQARCWEATSLPCWRPCLLGVLGVAAWPRLQVLGGAENFGGEHWDDPVVKPAIVARGGAVVWDPNPPRQELGARGARKRSRPFLLRYASLVSASRPPAAAPTGTAVEGNGIGGFGGASPMPLPPPEEANAVIAWIQAPRHRRATACFEVTDLLACYA